MLSVATVPKEYTLKYASFVNKMARYANRLQNFYVFEFLFVSVVVRNFRIPYVSDINRIKSRKFEEVSSSELRSQKTVARVIVTKHAIITY